MKTAHPLPLPATGSIRTAALLAALVLSLTACTAGLQPVRPAVYDFGPGLLRSAAATPAPQPSASRLIIGAIEAAAALDSTTVQYRLAYADALQLKPYAKARWSMAPAELIRQRLLAQLGQHYTLLNPGEGGLPDASGPSTLRVDLEEFSQLFQAPEQSIGLLRLRVTLVQARSKGPARVAQRSITVQRPAPSADASGGVQALAAAADAAVLEIDEWLRTLAP